MDLKNLNCLYSLTGDYDLNDKKIDWSKTILLDKFNNKMVLLGGLLEFKFTDISDDFTELVEDAYKQTALSQNGGVQLYNSMINVTDQIKDGLSEHIKHAFDSLKEMQAAHNEQNIFGSARMGASKPKEMEELLKNFKLYTDLVNETLGKHEEKIKEVKGEAGMVTPDDIDEVKNLVSAAQTAADNAKTAADAAQATADQAVTDAADAAQAAADAADAAQEAKELIDGLRGESFDEINENYDTIKELADYVTEHGTEFAGIVKDIRGEKSTNEDGEEITEGGLLNDVADIKSDIEEIKSALGTEDGEGESIVSRIEAIEDELNGTGEDEEHVAGLKEKVAAAESAVKDNVDEIASLKEIVGHDVIPAEGENAEEPATGLVKKVADLEDKIEETPENVVTYSDETLSTIELKNGVSISAKDTQDGVNNLVKLSKYDTAEFGSVAAGFNINAADGKVTINDSKIVATTNDIEIVAMSALADLRERLKITPDDDPEGTASTDLLLSSAAAIDTLDVTANPGTYKTVNIIGGSTDKTVKLAATEGVNIINMELGAYGDEATLNTTGKNRIRVSTPDLKVNNLVIADECDAYNIIECDSTTPVDNVEVYNLDVPYSKITHNIVNVYCPADNAKIVISNCSFDINPENTNPLRLSNYKNAKNVTVVFSDVDWTYNHYTGEDYEYAGLCLYQPAHTDDAYKNGDYSAFKTWNFVFKNCKFNGEKVTVNNMNGQDRAVYVYNKGIADPAVLGATVTFE